MNRAALYLELAKVRILSMVLVTTTLGFFLGGRGLRSFPHFLLTLLGVGCATGGAAMLKGKVSYCTSLARSKRGPRLASNECAF